MSGNYHGEIGTNQHRPGDFRSGVPPNYAQGGHRYMSMPVPVPYAFDPNAMHVLGSQPQPLPLDPRERLLPGRGCLYCNAPCPRWEAFCSDAHRTLHLDHQPDCCRQCYLKPEFVDASTQKGFFRDRVCSYACGTLLKFHLPGRVTAGSLDLYIRETSSLEAQEAQRQLRKPVPPEYACLTCKAYPSAPWSLFCGGECHAAMGQKAAQSGICQQCFQKPKRPNSYTCSDECGYRYESRLPGRVTHANLQQFSEYRERLKQDREVDRRRRVEPEQTDLPRKRDQCLKCRKPLSDPLMDVVARLKCGHEFHSVCLHNHLRNEPQGNYCPVCGEQFANVDPSQTPRQFTWHSTAVSLRRLEHYQ